MCSQSFSTKKCVNILNGERCKNGWHIKGTVPDYSNSSSSTSTNIGTEYLNQPSHMWPSEPGFSVKHGTERNG